MVDAHLRSKAIETADIKNLIIGGQTGIDGIRFCLASITNGENLADPLFSWFLQYKNKNGQGESVGLSPIYENGLIKLPWIPNSLATQVPGRMQIQLYAAIVTGEGEAAVVDKQWVSEPAVIYIQENINPEPIVATEPSVIEYYVTLYAAYKNAAEAAATTAEEQAIIAAQQAGSAADSAGEALLSAQAAAESAGDALTSAEAAALSEGNALESQQAAALSAGNAADSETAALASKNAAALSESNASNSATDALASKNAAALSEEAAQAAQAVAEEKAELLSSSLAQIAVNKAAIEALSMNGDIVGLKYNKVTKVYTRLGAAASWSAGRCNGAYDANVVSDFDQHPLYELRKKFKANNDFSSVVFRGEDGYAELDGDHYVRQPIGWFADYEDSDDRIVLLAAVPVPGLTIHPNFLDKNGKPLPYVDYACVEGSVVDGIMYSKPDLQPKNRITLTAANLAARSKGSATSGIYTLEPWIASDFEVLMMAVEFGTFDAQSAIGLGMTTFLISDSYKTTFDGVTPNTFITTNSIASQFQVGDYVDLGTNYYNGSLVIGRKILAIADYDASNKVLTFDGAEVTVPINTVVTWASCPVPSTMIDVMQGKSGYILERGIESRSHVCWRDIWDKWGNDWEIKDGTIKFDNRMYVGTDPETYHLYYNNPSVVGSTYENTGYITLQASGYVGSMKRVGKDGSSFTIPVVDSLGGASIGGYGAYHYDNNGAGGARIVLVGGVRSSGRNCSPVFVSLDSAVGSSYFLLAARLFHRPK